MQGSFASLKRFVSDSSFANNSSDDAPVVTGRRGAARLRTSIPARLVTLSGTKHCVLIDVSCSGAQISLANPLREGESGFLQFAQTEVFGCVIREGQGVNGLQFDIPMTDEDILEIRRLGETFDRREKEALRAEVRAWVSGES